MTGTAAFVRRFLRRDRWMLVWWVLGGTLLFYSTAASVDDLYPTQADFDKAATSLEGNAAFVAMAGPARALDTLGGQVAWQCTAFGAILAGLMSMFIIGRHTRAEEESGREELLRSAAVDRRASTVAAVIVALTANLLLGVLVTASLTSYGLAFADCLGLGLGLTFVGWCFTGTALIAAQLTSTTRAMYGMAGAVVGLAYGLRAVGDVGGGVLSWLSPIGWYQAMHQFSGLRWWPALLLVGGASVSLTAGLRLFGLRDYGGGIVAARPGPARAGRGLRSGSLGLAWRLQRGAVIGWAAGMFFGGLAYGAIGDQVSDVIGGSDTAHDVLAQAGGSLVDSFYATSILMLAVIAGGFSVSSSLRPSTEEERSHLEVVMATAEPRIRWLGGHTLITVVGTGAVLGAAGLGLGLGYLWATGDGATAWDLTYPIMQYVAPVLVLSAVARLLFGIDPAFLKLAWIPLGFVAVVMVFGQVLQLPQWVRDISPFEHLALMPAQSFDPAAFVIVMLLAIVVSVTGHLAFRRRDLR